MQKEIILTVHKSAGNNYRLALSTKDINKIKPKTVSDLSVSLGGETFRIEGALDSYKEFGTLGSTDIYNWIRDNGYNIYEKNKNPKFIFTISMKGSKHHYELYKNQDIKH